MDLNPKNINQMEKIPFNQLLLQTAFCCIASDGNIDKREIAIIKSLFEDSEYFENTNLQDEMNQLIMKINDKGTDFFRDYFLLLNEANLTEDEELIIIDYALQTINSDDKVEYSEIKFFKNIRHRLRVSNEKILAKFPEIEMYLEDDIITVSLLDRITKQYFEIADLPHFEAINFDTSSFNDKTQL